MLVRAVLDTQVVLRGLLGIRRSACAFVFDALAEGAFIAVASPHILTELGSVLSLPKIRARYHLTDDQVAEFLDSYNRQAESVAGTFLLPEQFRIAGGVPAAPVAPAVPVEDIPIVSAALEGGADHIVTDDSGLLDVKTIVVSGYAPVDMIAPGHFSNTCLAEALQAPPPDRQRLHGASWRHSPVELTNGNPPAFPRRLARADDCHRRANVAFLTSVAPSRNTQADARHVPVGKPPFALGSFTLLADLPGSCWSLLVAPNGTQSSKFKIGKVETISEGLAAIKGSKACLPFTVERFLKGAR